MATKQNKILVQEANSQVASPLFASLPAELRYQIYCYALTDYPDPSPTKRYDETTCYTRPLYFAPRKSDVALLYTCRAVYSECWFLPFLLREQIHWLTSPDRAPPGLDIGSTLCELEAQLALIRDFCGNEKELVIDGLHVFAQMWAIERGQLASLLETRNLNPRRLVLTIRHTDWWFWEDEAPLRFEGHWLEAVSRVLPESVREICIELETLERWKNQVDSIAKQMRERWFFKNTSGGGLFADAKGGSCSMSRWTGASTWNNRRWERDESREGQIDYYILAVTFLPEYLVKRVGGAISPEAKAAADNNVYNSRVLKLHQHSEQERIDMMGEEDDEEEEEEEDESD